MIEPEDFYDKYCQLYHYQRITRGKLFNEFIEMPVVLNLIREKYSKSAILDIGCGSGIYAKILASNGHTVDGLDVSQGMINIATKYCEGLSARFFHTSFEDFEATGQYDIVLGSFLLGYINDLDSFFAKSRSLIAKNGLLIISGIHPIRESSIVRNDKQYIIEDYFNTDEYDSIIIDEVPPLKLAKHTFSDISQSAYINDLNIQQILEPKPVIDGSKYAGTKNIDFYNHNPSVLIVTLKPNSNDLEKSL